MAKDTMHFTFGGPGALPHIIRTTLHLRRHGYKTRLAERVIAGHEVHTVVATKQTESRKVRLAGFLNTR